MEFAAPRLLAHGLDRSLTEDGNLHLAHCALHAEQQPVVRRTRIIDGFFVDDQRTDQAAELKQGMPVTAVTRQARGFQRYHCTDPTFADCSEQFLESWTSRTATGSAEIVIDKLNFGPAKLPCPVY